MSKQMKTNLIKCSITTVVALALTVYYVVSRNFGEQELVERYRILCDGFFLPGVFMIMIGLMFTMNNVGALDAIGYLLKYAVRTFVPGAFGEMEHYLDYVEARREKRITGYQFLFVVGGAFMVAACIFLALFYSVF